jgi:quinol monooxygenase YgiN
MLIYEVNLTVNREIVEAYMEWLKPHIEQILKFEGFMEAHLYKRRSEDEGSSDTSRIYFTVQYHLKDRPSLDAYLKDHAPAMRTDGIKRFGDKFSAQRRVLEEIER